MITNEEYLGDGLYVGIENNYQVVLAANAPVTGNPTDKVYLDQSVISAFILYLKRNFVGVGL